MTPTLTPTREQVIQWSREAGLPDSISAHPGFRDAMRIAFAAGQSSGQQAERDELTEQLAAAQAVIAKKDEAIRKHLDPTWECNSDHPALAAAISIPSDDTALREMLAEQREKAAEYVGRNLMSCGEYADALRAEAEKLRKKPVVDQVQQ